MSGKFMSQRDKPAILLKQKLQFRRKTVPLHEGRSCISCQQAALSIG
jgi:hypothetical protein